MKETIQDLLNRRSVKEFREEQITREELLTVLSAGMNAPTGAISKAPFFLQYRAKNGWNAFAG